MPAQPKPQSAKSHTAVDPIFQFIILPLLLVDVLFAIYVTIRHWPDHPHLHPWWIVLSIVLLLMAMRIRVYALRLQDRVIRLEERVRLATLLPPATLAASHALTTPQLIALRFASDAELPTLVDRTLTGNLTPSQIKDGIVSWRPDYARV